MKRRLLEEDGNLESALVLIPLLILFLVGFQIALVSHQRNVERVHVQNDASVRAISGEFLPADDFLHIESGGDAESFDLLVTRNQKLTRGFQNLPLGFGSSLREIDISGLALIENSR